MLLGAVFLLPFLSARTFSPSFDEHTHLSSGYSYLKTGEVRLNPQHPPLIKEMAALPLLFLKPVMPEPAADTNEWDFGLKFLFGSGNDADKLLLWGRLPIMLISVLLGFFVYKWASELFNRRAGLVALFLYAFMPNIIAHSQFVTTDIGVSAFSFITLYWLWKYFRTHAFRHLVFTGLFLGLALGSKFSAALLLPIIAVLVLFYLWSCDDRRLMMRVIGFFKIVIPVFLLGFAAVYALYFFPKDILFYWKGVTSIYADKSPNAVFYLNGNFSPTGWWYYFIAAFLMKTPIPFLILLAGSLLAIKKLGVTLMDSLFLLLPPAVFFFVTNWKALDLGIRYLLPVYPFLMVLAGIFVVRVLSWGMAGRSKVIRFSSVAVMATLLFWYAGATLKSHPDYLAYFNELAGGADNGAKHLDGANVDWGYDLKRLKEYQIKNPDTKVVWNQYWSGFDYYGIKNNVFDSEKWWSQPRGRYAVSANLVIRTKLRGITAGDSEDWLTAYTPIDRIGQSFLIYEFK